VKKIYEKEFEKFIMNEKEKKVLCLKIEKGKTRKIYGKRSDLQSEEICIVLSNWKVDVEHHVVRRV
jgi:hypothetical protein